jgi:hypothetical protein
MTDHSAGFSATWQQLFDMAAAVGRGAPAPGARRGGGGRRLAHSDEAWTGAAAALREVGGGLGRVGGDLTEAHAAIGPALAGLSATEPLTAVRASWEERFDAAVVECEALARALVAVAEEQGAYEAGARASFGRRSGDVEGGEVGAGAGTGAVGGVL